jgi:hypothetical protein
MKWSSGVIADGTCERDRLHVKYRYLGADKCNPGGIGRGEKTLVRYPRLAVQPPYPAKEWIVGVDDVGPLGEDGEESHCR